jgi:hypothetical protein
MGKFSLLFFVSGLLLSFQSCQNDDEPNKLLGETDIPLTQVGGNIGVYIKMNGQNIDAKSEMNITSNKEGVITYEGTINMDKLTIHEKQRILDVVPTILNIYKPKDVTFKPGLNNIDYSLKTKVTSKGFQHQFTNGKTMTIKYEDPEGTEYKVILENGEVFSGKVTEKSGKDDFPFGFFNIKTSKIDFVPAVSDPTFNHMTIRINHKFGLVYLKTEVKNGDIIEFNFFPWHVI